MDYSEAIKRIANHANKPMDDDIAPEESLVFNLWQANRDKIFPSIDKLVRDILNCLEIVNLYLNGSNPSSTSNKKIPDFELVMSISLIITAIQEYELIWQKRLLFEENELKIIRLALWKISQAWCAVLHGDIDSIENELHLQRETKGF